MSYRDTVQSLTDERYLGSLDVSYNSDFLLSEVMESEVADSVSEYTLLDKKHVSSTCDDFFDKSDDIFSLLFQDTINLTVILDYDVVVHVSLWAGKTELEKCDLRVLNRTSSWDSYRFVWEN